MQPVRQLLGSRIFWYSAGAVFGLQFLLLLLSTPMYEIDTNSFIRGGFSWDIYHNPLLNLYIAAMTKIWANVWFIVAGQLLLYAFAATFLAFVLFPGHRARGIALAIAAIEPLTMFYNFSMLAESFFTAFTLLAVGMLILWTRHKTWQLAALFGLAMGLTFMSKLSAMIHLPLFGVLLVAGKMTLTERMKTVGYALAPFVLCYGFVFSGQKVINGGDIYTVEGRVRWDFSSSMYNPAEVEGAMFKQYVDPYIIDENGNTEPHRERRRELSYLGYKDCVADFEAQGHAANRGINACDSLFGAVAAQLMEKHFWAAEWQFIADNFRFLHELSYIDYRFTEGLHYYHPDHEYTYIDSLMATHYGFNLAERADRIPGIWTSLSFGNTYMPLLWYLWWIALGVAVVLWFRDRSRYELLVLAGLTAIPLLFHLVYISYRARFLAPYLVLLLFLVIFEVILLRSPKTN